ncbi:hypothetical protein MABM_30160 [Mycobacteroides abscessus]|uniref:hypothetical protein n=1 Tax=Mycobacteroides abscessus TaxID=36809 RepID=UPI00039FCEFD|nr:hypothetical protein [Mycobacteroides abscessus]BBZ83100.1 hypothetical protein MABM_30160 [Mycobacteroides abscessus]
MTERLFALIARARFRSPGTSDPYTDTLVLWVSLLGEVREILAPLDYPDAALSRVERVFRVAIESWLDGHTPVDDEALLAELEEVVTE